MIQLSSLNKAFGVRVLFQDVTWQVQTGDRVGLCGSNGVGKTTLLKIMAHLEDPDNGTVTQPSNCTVGYLPQDGLSHKGHTLFTEVSTAFKSLLAIQAEMRELENQLEDQSLLPIQQQKILTRYSEAQETFRHQGGYDIESRVTNVLHGLGFKKNDFEKPTENFSGGWQMRIALAKLLLNRPDLLLMDEPTNHLDLEASNWLIEFLVSYPHTVVLVSHDRFFLDNVVTEIAEVSLKKLTTYRGSYSDYLVEREERLIRLRKQKTRQDEEIARIQTFIDRFRYKATKAAQVQSRIKMLEKISPIEVPPDYKRVHFHFPPTTKSGRIVFDLRDVQKSYGNLMVFNCVNIHIERGDRIAMVGPNGSGKSTLMRILAGSESPDRGMRIEGQNVVAQYFAQDEPDRLEKPLSVYETLATGSPLHMVPAIRNILGGFLFEGDDVYKRVSVLSGGERTRLAVARMLLHPSNVLLLDEPTNHLDIDSTNVLLDALIDYGETLIFVSHDRYFVDRLATKVLEIGHGKAVLYPGSYEEFRWSVEQRTETESTENNQKKLSANKLKKSEHRKVQIKSRQHRTRLRNLQTRITALEQRINKSENAVRELEIKMSKPGFFDDLKVAQEANRQHQALMWTVGDLINQWEALQKEAEELSQA